MLSCKSKISLRLFIGFLAFKICAFVFRLISSLLSALCALICSPCVEGGGGCVAGATPVACGVLVPLS